MRPRRHPFSIALLAVGVTLTAGACSGDDGGGSDTVINDATISSDTSSPGVDPTVSIMSPSADARFLPDETVAFEAHVDGRGEALAGLEFRVESSANDRGDALKVGSVPESGVIGATFAALKPGAQTITVSVLRAGSVVCSASVDIEVRTPGAAPTLAIAPEAPKTGDTVNATVTPPEGVVGDAHYRWLRAAEAITTDAPLSAAVTKKGEEYRLEGWLVVDGLETPRATLPFTIANTPPTCGLVTIFPTGVTTTDKDIVCACADFVDPDEGDEDHSTCAFYDDAHDGVLIDTDGACTLPAAETEKGMVIRCVLTPSDGEDAGEETASPTNSTDVTNSAPSAPTVSLAPEAGDATTTFTCSASGSVDPDAGDSVTYLVAWYVDDAVVAGVTTGSATGAELGASHGDAIACGVKASDGAASSAEVRSDARTLGNATPTLDNVFITAAHMPPTKADTLACEPQDGADPDDGDTLTYSYTWTRNGAVIAGATGATLAGEAFAKGDRIGCTAQGCDAGGACTPVVSSKTIMTIGNALPFVTGVAMTEVAAHGEADGNAQPGDVLTCEYATATDLDQGDAIEIIYGFYEVKADGTVVELYSGSDASYAVPETLTPGSTLYCTVTPTNPPDPGPRGESQSFDVVEPTPIPPVVAVSAPNGADGDVTCEITTPAQWFGSGATTTWYWTVNGGAETEGAQVLANADVDGCDLVKCRVVVANAATSLSSNTASKSLPLGSTGCDDGNACTQATCKAAGGCNFIVTPGALCDDGDACSPSSACDSEGACVAQSDICVEDALDVTTEVQHWPTVAALPSGGYLARFGAATPRYRLTDANDTRVQEEKALTTGADAQFRTRPAVGANGKALVTTWSFSWANSNHQNYFSALVVDTATGELGANYHLHTRGMWGGGAYYEPIAPDSVALPYSDGSWGVFLNDTYTSAFYVIGAPPQPGQHYIQYWTISADGVASAATTLFGEANVARRAYPTDARLIPDGSDRFVAAWLMGDERTITARLYTKSGTEVLPQPITVTTAAEGSAIDTVRVLGLRNGAFWVAWSESLGDADGYGVKIQRFTASGAPNGALFVATADEIGQQHLGDLAAFSDYGVVLVYDDSLIDGAGAGVAAQLITSGGVLDGGAVQLNGYAAGDQVEASVATLPGDEMVVTWRDGANRLWTRRFDRTVARFGTAFEIPANDGTFGAQRAPAVATLITGETLVAWDSDVFGDPDLMARVFDADGNAQSADLPVSTYGTGAQISAVAAGGTSRFVVAWDSQEQNGGVDGIVARWLDADGEAVSDEVVVTTAVGAQRDPAVAMTWGDDALVAWTADSVTGTSVTDVKVRPYDLDGEAMGPEVVVNATTAQAQAQPAVAAFPSGRSYVVGWQSRNQDLDGNGVYLRKLTVGDDGGVTFATGELRANQTTAGDQQAVSVAVSGIGMVAACWESAGQDGSTPASWGVYCRVFNGTTLAPLAAEFRVHAVVAGDQRRPKVTALADGRFLVAWETAGLDGRGVAVQSAVFDSGSTLRGPRMTMNRWWDGDQTRPAVAATPDGAVVGWESSAQDQDGAGIFFRVIPLD